jgi:predicted P-loop ATPase
MRASKCVDETEDLIPLCKKSTEWKGRLPKKSEIWQFAKHCSYNPIVNYLKLMGEAWSENSGDPQKYIDEFTEEVLGVSDPLDLMFVRRTLVGAVTRAMNPGCEMDTVLVLVGPQGAGKSRFFEHLFGPDNYGLIYEGSGDKDWRLAMHSVWVAEMGEIDGHLRKKDASQVKSIITEATDKFRVPYGRDISSHKRPCILVGTTNQEAFLVDTTGNRRFWVVKVNKQIDQEVIQRRRNKAWAGAYQIWKKNLEPYYIDYSEKELMEALNQRNLQHLDEHPWEDTISLIVDCMDVNGRFEPDEAQAELLNRGRLLQLGNYAGRYLQTRDILELLGKETSRQTKADSNRVSQSMRGLHNFQLAVREGQRAWVLAPSC